MARTCAGYCGKSSRIMLAMRSMRPSRADHMELMLLYISPGSRYPPCDLFPRSHEPIQSSFKLHHDTRHEDQQSPPATQSTHSRRSAVNVRSNVSALNDNSTRSQALWLQTYMFKLARTMIRQRYPWLESMISIIA